MNMMSPLRHCDGPTSRDAHVWPANLLAHPTTGSHPAHPAYPPSRPIHTHTPQHRGSGFAHACVCMRPDSGTCAAQKGGAEKLEGRSRPRADGPAGTVRSCADACTQHGPTSRGHQGMPDALTPCAKRTSRRFRGRAVGSLPSNRRIPYRQPDARWTQLGAQVLSPRGSSSPPPRPTSIPHHHAVASSQGTIRHLGPRRGQNHPNQRHDRT